MRGHARCATSTFVAIVVGLLLAVGLLPPPSGAITATAEPGAGIAAADRGGRATSEPVRYVRRLLYDLHNQGDPDPAFVDYLYLLLYVETGGMSVPHRIEWLQARLEGRVAVVEDLFLAALRRDLDQDSRDAFLPRLAKVGRLKLMADLLGSAEYRTTQGGGTDGGWIDAVYRDALGRPADAAGRAYFLGQLAQGRTRAAIASSITGGAEGRRALVKRLMTELLRRPADAAGVTYFAGRLTAGTTVERVVAMIASSPEYQVKARASYAQHHDLSVVALLQGNLIEHTSLDGSPTILPRRIEVSGVPEGQELLGIDIRPATEVLYGVTTGGQVVSITPGGVATLVGPPLPGFDWQGRIGIDVDPVADEVVVTTGVRAYRVDPDTGAAVLAVSAAAFGDGDVHEGADAWMVANAFTDSWRWTPPPTTTTQMVIEGAHDVLATLGPDGELSTVGPLHVDVYEYTAFDIAPEDPKGAYAFMALPGSGWSTWRIDLITGEPRLLRHHIAERWLGLAVVGTEDAQAEELAYGVTPGASPQLRRFTTRDPDVTASWSIAGINAGTDVVGLDARPATGDLFAIGSDGQVYALTFAIGAPAVLATPRGAPLPQFAPADGVGFDVDPAEDAIRVVNGDRSYRVRLADGVVYGDGATPGTPGLLTMWPPGSPAPMIAGTAFTASQRGAPAPPADPDAFGSGSLEHIDLTGVARLVSTQPFKPLEVAPVGPLLGPGTNVTAVDGFDISGSLHQSAVALARVDGHQVMIDIDLATGAAHHVVEVSSGPGVVYTAFALV
ncbi:MAG TPA: DUF4394 domain-containing protein [Iamia sp.]